MSEKSSTFAADLQLLNVCDSYVIYMLSVC